MFEVILGDKRVVLGSRIWRCQEAVKSVAKGTECPFFASYDCASETNQFCDVAKDDDDHDRLTVLKPTFLLDDLTEAVTDRLLENIPTVGSF